MGTEIMAQKPNVTRRAFVAASAAAAVCHRMVHGAAPMVNEDLLRQALGPYVLKHESLDRFLDPKARVWARFHPRYGYLLRNSFVRDGVDGSRTLARYEEPGYRHQTQFRDQPCRINTYGDSFTQGHQVSDGETWQEVLAAHFCEPIRNYGIGGFGVYQASQRLLEVETTALGAEYLIFNIWGDDHFRSIYPWRWLAFPNEVIESMSGTMFHANPWVHASLDPDSGELVDRPNPCPDEATLRKLCELDFVVETFGGNAIVQTQIAARTGRPIDLKVLQSLANQMEIQNADWNTEDAIRRNSQRILHRYGVRVGMKIMERVHEFANQQGKKLMVLLSYPVGSIWHACNGTQGFNETDHVDWHPQEFQDLLRARGIPFVDTKLKHVAEYKTFRLSPKEYVDRYYIGHYTPTGNHFFAYAIKNEVRDWLSPQPPAYLNEDEPLIRFEGYLPG